MDGCIYRTKDGECDLYSEGGKFKAFCVGNEPCEGRKLSNADRIRSMSDEELAEFFEDTTFCDSCFIFKNECGTERYSCKQRWLDWLQQEAE